MDPKHHLIHKINPHFRGYRIRHDIKQRYRKFIWGTFTGETTRSFWKPRRKTMTHFRKMYHVDYDSDHDDYEFLTHPQNLINAKKRRRALRIVKLKLQSLFNKEQDKYMLLKPPYVDEEFHPNTNPRTMKLNLKKVDHLQKFYEINKIQPILFSGGFLTYLQENGKFSKKLYYKLQRVLKQKKLKKFGLKNVFNYLKNGVRQIGKKYQKNEFRDELLNNEINNQQGQENWRQLRLKSHPYLQHFETDQNLQDEQFQTLDVKLGEDGRFVKNYSNLNITETFEILNTKLKQIIKINPKSLFRFSYFIKSYLFLLQIQFQEKEMSEDLVKLAMKKSRAIFQIKKKGEKWLREKQMKRLNRSRKQTDTEKQYKLLVKKIQSEVNKRQKDKQKKLELPMKMVPNFLIHENIRLQTKTLQWVNKKEEIQQISQIIGNEKSFLHQDDIFVDQNRNQDYESVDEDQVKKKKFNTQKMMKNYQRKKHLGEIEKSNILQNLEYQNTYSIRRQKIYYHQAIKRYHDLRIFQDLLDKEDIGFPQEYLQYIQIDEDQPSKQERQSTRRSKSVPSRKNKQSRIKEKRSYSQEKMNDLLEQFDQIVEKECQRDLFRIASILMQQKQCRFKNKYYKRIRKVYFKNFRPRRQKQQQQQILKQLMKEDSEYRIMEMLDQLGEEQMIKKQKRMSRFKRNKKIKLRQKIKQNKRFLQSEDDYQHRIFFKQLINSDKKFFSRIFGIDVVGNYLHYYKTFASQLFDNCQVCLQSSEVVEEENDQLHDWEEDEGQDQEVQQQYHQKQDEKDQISPEKKNTLEAKILKNKQIMPFYLKLARKYQKQKNQNVVPEQDISDDEFDFENEKLENINNTENNQLYEEQQDYYGMEVEINIDREDNEIVDKKNINYNDNIIDDNNIDQQDNNDLDEIGFGPECGKVDQEKCQNELNKFINQYMSNNRWKHQTENDDQIELNFPLFQDMYKDETYNDCFNRQSIYFDKTQRGQYHYYQQLLTIQCRPQVSENLLEEIQDSSQPNLFRLFYKNFHQVTSNDILKNLNLKDYPLPIEIVMENKDLLLQNEFEERISCYRFHNLPIKPLRRIENEFEAQMNFYRQFAQYTELRDMPKYPDNPYLAFKKKNFNGEQSIGQSIKAVKAWVNMSLNDRKDYLRTFYSEVVMCYRRLDKWLKQANFNQDDLDFMGVMDIEDFVWELYHLDIFWEILEKQVKIATVSFDDVLIYYARRNLKKRHPDKMTKQRIQRELKLRLDPKARARAKKQLLKKRAKRFRQKQEEIKRLRNIAILQARRNQKQASQFAQYFSQKGPLLKYFENVFVKSIRIDVFGIMKKAIRKQKFKTRLIYVDGKGYQKDQFIQYDHQGYQRFRVARISQKYGDCDMQQNLADIEQIHARKNDRWINQDYKNLPPKITKSLNNISSDIRTKDIRNQVRVCRKLYFDNISQKAKDLAKQQNIETNNYLFQKQQENKGLTTVIFDDKEWLVCSHDIRPFKQLVDMTKELEQNEQESLLKRRINAKNKIRRIFLQKQEKKYQRKRNLYIYRDLPDNQQPDDPREFILNVDEMGILNGLKRNQGYLKWLQYIKYYKAKGWDLTPLLRQIQNQKENEGQDQKDLELQNKQFRMKLEKELRLNKIKANVQKNKFLREKKKLQYLASMLKVDENYGKQNHDEKLEQEDSQQVQSEIPDIKLTDRENLRIRKFLKRLNIEQDYKSLLGIDQLIKFVKDNKDPVSNLYENQVAVEQLEKDVKNSKHLSQKIMYKPWYKQEFKKKRSPMKPFRDENGDIVRGIHKQDYLKALYKREQLEEQRIWAEIAELKIQRQGMTQMQIMEEILKTPKLEEQTRQQVRKVQLQDILSEQIAISKKKNITKKKQKKDQSDQSSSEREQKKGKGTRQVSQKQTKNHQVQQQTKGKQEKNIKPNNQQVKQGESKFKGRRQFKLQRNIVDKEKEEEIEQESQIILQNKRRLKQIHKDKVPINPDSSEDQVDEWSEEDVSYDDSSDEKEKNKKKGGQKQKGKNNRK